MCPEGKEPEAQQENAQKYLTPIGIFVRRQKE